ncbi:hypothetical protein EDC05_006030 [Coemansia umbellata]|uniref:Peptidase M20 dimerisation domain-containing protein n=1 Tax=Coemansia umbellata TaxID=1424467 RepID=A0ABQ8PEQ3_9FUNG|nr:hypothetical protein EDC05_006030 [Coemansia umbellata]
MDQPRLNGFHYTQRPAFNDEAADAWLGTSQTVHTTAPPTRSHSMSSLSNTSPPLSSPSAGSIFSPQQSTALLQRPASQSSITATPHTTAPLNQTTVHCIQTLSQARDQPEGSEYGSVLAIAQSNQYVFSGSQRGDIYVWSRESYRLEHILVGHTAGCLSLALDEANKVLYSGGGDGKVRAWDAEQLKCLYIIHAGVNSGAILSLAYSVEHGLLVMGCQNTSIQWFDVANRDAVGSEQRARELAARRSRFFDDSVKPLTVCASYMDEDEAMSVEPEEEFYLVSEASTIHYAHSGYVYSLLLGGADVLFSAASDGSIKLWRLGSVLEETAVLDRASDADACVHSLALGDELLYAGLQSGTIEVWDLETMQRIRTLEGHTANVLTLAMHMGCLFSGAADGTVRVWGADLQNLGWIRASADSVLALVGCEDTIISGGGDGALAFWDVGALQHDTPCETGALHEPLRRKRGRRMLQALGQWIRMRSVSGVPELQHECRRAARFLRDLMRQLGAADARLIASTPTSNPIVYGRFDATADVPLAERRTVFVYGHYDVMPAGDEKLWRTEPFDLVGRDGYLYGRGVSDDKGPVLATLFAVAELAQLGQLPLTVVFCIEGEEEHGSVGLHETIAEHRALFGQPRLVLLSSSYWLGETTPCLTYGMRGSIRANLRIESSRKADVHAGVWGGAVNEPLVCLSHILARLADPTGRVLVPGFLDDVRAVDPKEEQAMRNLVGWIAAKEARAPLVARTMAQADTLDDLYNQLMQRWRFPTLTVHHVDVSTVAARSNATLVPAAAQAALSVRVVPDQSLEDIAEKLRHYVHQVFDEIMRDGRAVLDGLKLHLDVRPNAMWWLADPETPVYQAAARAIQTEWGSEVPPLLIREGGSIPAVPWLESFFDGAVAVNLPMGQSSDNAHLDNERISLENLVRGRQVVWRLIKDIGKVL